MGTKRAERVVFAGLARDCASALPSVLANIAAMSDQFRESAFLFLENGSRDGTRGVLEQWCRSRPEAQLLSPDHPDAFSPVRTIRLAALRNQLIAAIRERFSDFDLVVMMDCDEVNAAPTDMADIGLAVDFLMAEEDRAGVFANMLGGYIDYWALRHPTRCPDDVWEAMLDYVVRHGVGDDAAYDAVFAPRLFALAADAAPLEVDSAFGGLGIYRLKKVLANPASYVGAKRKTVPMQGGVREVGWQTCEHVSFHAGLRAEGGRLFILPGLVIGRVERLDFPHWVWRSMVF